METGRLPRLYADAKHAGRRGYLHIKAQPQSRCRTAWTICAGFRYGGRMKRHILGCV